MASWPAGAPMRGRPNCSRATSSPGPSAARSTRAAGRPHGGVFLDIASRRSPEEIIRKLPGMYHQFKELADVDITKDPMEVGPTCHYMMGGVRVDPETQESTVPGLFAAGEVAAGMHGANRLGGNSLSDLLVFGQRAASLPPPSTPPGWRRRRRSIPRGARLAREPLAPSTRRQARTRTPSTKDLRAMMQRRVGIVRSEEDLAKALEELGRLRRAGRHGSRRGQHPVQPRLAPGARPEH